MLRRLLFAAFASLLLTACGRGSEDFTVKVARPAERVAVAFGGIGLDAEIASLFPGAKVVRTQPAKNEILYTIPGDGDFPAAIKLTFEPGADGKTSIVHAAVDVPSTKVTFDGKAMVISEGKVESAFRSLIRSAAKKLENGESIDDERQSFSRLLTVLAIITDSKKLRLAQDISAYPEWYMSGMGWLSGLGGGSDYPYGDYAGGEDPGAAARVDEYKQSSQERRERDQAEENARPMDDARGDSANGDYAGGSDE